MRNTLYFALADVPSAEQTIQDLLHAKIEIPRIYCVARRGVPLGELPEANVLQKADIAPVAGLGFVLGGMLGGMVGDLLILFPPLGAHFSLWTMPIAATLGACVSSIAGIVAPNSRIAAFERDFSHGNILLMVDVPYARSLEIVALVQSRNPAPPLAEAEPATATSRAARA